jgi:hypothetical protein
MIHPDHPEKSCHPVQKTNHETVHRLHRLTQIFMNENPWNLWTVKPSHYFEQKETKGTKRTAIIKGLLCSLCSLLFKKTE